MSCLALAVSVILQCNCVLMRDTEMEISADPCVHMPRERLCHFTIYTGMESSYQPQPSKNDQFTIYTWYNA